METNVNYTLVGAFVIILLASIIFVIIWLSSGLSLAQYSTYMIYMQESVAGLNVDAPVEYNGVDVGLVKEIELNRKNPQLVELTLGIKSNTPITMGTEAMLATRGITGITYIALKDKSADLRPLVAVPGQHYPIIKTVPSIFTRLDTTLSQLTNDFYQITRTFQSLLDKENQQSIKDTLFNLKRVTGTLASNSKKLDAILLNTSIASQQFMPLVQTSMGAMNMLQTQTLPAAFHVLSNLDNLSRTLYELSVELKQNPSMIIRGVQPPPLGPGETK